MVGKVEEMYHAVGGHISPCICERDWILKLPPEPEPLAFSGMLLTQVGLNSATRVPVEKGDPAVVIGDGLVAQWAAQTLAWRGAKVVMVGMEDDRLALGERFARATTFNIRRDDWTAEVKKMFPGGLAVAVDAAGSRDATEKLIGLMRKRGNIVTTGFCGTDDMISLQSLRDQEIAISAVSGHNAERMDQTLKLITQGHLQTLPLITHHYPVQEAPEVWRRIEARSEPMLGVIFDW